MDEALELKQVSEDFFVNVHTPWHPGGARGVFGGVLIAQSLVAASQTVPDAALAHSMHCNFIIGGDAQLPFTYQVSRLLGSDGMRVRQVKTHQRGRVIFTAMVSFQRPENDNHTSAMKVGKRRPDMSDCDVESLPIMSGGNAAQCPFLCTRIEGPDRSISELHQRRTKQWAKTKHPLSSRSGPDTQAAALAYITDNYFLCTLPRIHDLVDGIDPEAQLDPPRLDDARRRVKMMLSLDHSIYFHSPSTKYRADDWLFVEMESPWCGNDRALVLQRIYTRAGELIATSTQEGLVRMQQPDAKI